MINGKRVRVLPGPPGTGKTQTIQQEIERKLDFGLALEEVLYVVFQRNMARDFLRRMGVTSKDEERRLWMRTLHSACYKIVRSALGELGVLESGPALRAFLAELNIHPMSMHDRELLGSRGEEDFAAVFRWSQIERESLRDRNLIMLWTWTASRQASRTRQEYECSKLAPHPSLIDVASVDMCEYRTFVTWYEDYKKRNGLLDFTDMLGLVAFDPKVGHHIPPAWRHAWIDEAQDYTPLAWAAIQKLVFEHPRIETVTIAGDDDQAIFSFAGGDPKEFLVLARTADECRVLSTTYRFGEELREFAQRISTRILNRIQKDYRAANGLVTWIGSHDKLSLTSYLKTDQRVGILHRHCAGLHAWALNLIAEGIPFINERGLNPLSATDQILAWQTMEDLRNSSISLFPSSAISRLFDLIPMIDKRGDFGHRGIQYLRRGAKKWASEAERDRKSITRAEIMSWVHQDFFSLICDARRSLKIVPHGGYYSRLRARGFADWLDPEKRKMLAIIILTTIHGSKGREWDIVIAPQERIDYSLTDSEHRVWYVQATRARRRLIIDGQRWMSNGRGVVFYPTPSFSDLLYNT